MEIYICFCCGYPIVFRGRPPRVYHLGTGWPCWYLQQTGLCLSDLFPNLKIPSTTAKAKRAELLNEAKELYERYVSANDVTSVLRFVRARLESNEGDCVRDLFEYLASLGEKSGHALVRRIVGSDEWQRYLCAQRIERLYNDYVETHDSSPARRFIEGQLRAGQYECVRRLFAYLQDRGDKLALELMQAVAASGEESLPVLGGQDRSV